jgi:hypothetical protein
MLSIIYEHALTTNPTIETMSERPPSPMLPSMLPAKLAAKTARRALPVARKPAAKTARSSPPAARKAAAKTARGSPPVARKAASKTARRGARDGKLEMPGSVVAAILKRFHAPFRMHNGMTSPADASQLVPSSLKKRQTFAGLVASKLREAKTDH